MGGRGSNSGMRSSSSSGSTTYQKRSQLTSEGKQVFDVLEHQAGGVWAVQNTSSGTNVLSSNRTYTRQGAEKKVQEIKTELKSQGLSSSVARVGYFYSSATSGDASMRVYVTLKKKNSVRLN